MNICEGSHQLIEATITWQEIGPKLLAKVILIKIF